MEWQPEFDVEVARSLLGKYVLVGITDRNKDTDAVIGYRQLHGEIISADKQRGIVVRNRTTAQEVTLPPVTNRFEPADPGEYRLKATGEVVTDPDLLCTWTLYPK